MFVSVSNQKSNIEQKLYRVSNSCLPAGRQELENKKQILILGDDGGINIHKNVL